MENAESINMPMVDAFIARRILDRIAGFIVSKKLNSFQGYLLICRKVQSPTLKLVTDKKMKLMLLCLKNFGI